MLTNPIEAMSERLRTHGPI